MSGIPVPTTNSRLRLPIGGLKRPISSSTENIDLPVAKQIRFEDRQGSEENISPNADGQMKLMKLGNSTLQPSGKLPLKPTIQKSGANMAAKKAKRRSVHILNNKTATGATSLVKTTGGRLAGPRPVTIARTNQSLVAPSNVRPTVTVSQRNSTSSTISSRSSAGTGARPPLIRSSLNVPRPAPSGRKSPDTTEERLQMLEKKSTKDLQEREELKERLIRLEETNRQLDTNVKEKEKSTVEATQESEYLKRQLRTLTEEFESTTTKYRREKEDLTYRISTLEKLNGQLDTDLKLAKDESAGLRSSIIQFTSAQAVLEAQFCATKASLEASEADRREKQTKIHQLLREIEELKQSLEESNAKIRWGETERRKLHNTVQELKGNIRVFCRVRPLLEEEKIPGLEDQLCASNIGFPDPDKRVIELEKPTVGNVNESVMSCTKGGLTDKQSKFDFTFDRVFGPDASQLDIFEEISQLVQSALDGYNCCIFAYGQTGSGKTYTMEGPNPDVLRKHPDTAGMIPLAVRQVFQTATELKAKGWEYSFEASFIEIYNETLRDLLTGRTDVDIKQLSKNSTEVLVTNLSVEVVDSIEKLEMLLEKSRKSRAVAATKCNERSSRSHAVFRLKITGKNSLTSEACEGYLNLVDLAGSERLKESGATGDRLKETQNINGSLSTLGQVITSLANKDSHIPYRNSKLTFLLMNSLGGNSKTLMFVSISPREEHFNESLNSLRFATKVNQCQIGTAQKKTK